MHADPASFVGGVYTVVLGRPADAAGLAFWENVAATSAGPAAVALGILESAEADANSIRLDYEEFLNREPDTQGMNTWLNLLVQQLASPEQVELAILASDEFFGPG